LTSVARGEVEANAFREAMAAVCSPVAVVTSYHDERPHGTTVSAFCSLSLVPPLVLVSLDRGSDLLAMVQEAGVYGVNVLTHGQEGVATGFARKGAYKFGPDVEWRLDRGLPRIDGVACWLACRLEQLLDGGDHLIAVGLVEHAETLTADPLLYRQRAFGTFAPYPLQTPPPPGAEPA
jgi:flavin reductase (DIM6/NTAB) family NADH-FMN oxidoreductase RutF